MRKLLCLVLILLLPLCALAEGDLPAWDYPIAPEILQDPNDYIRLANRENLLDGSYVPSDLVRVTAKHVSARRSTTRCLPCLPPPIRTAARCM